MAKSSVPATQTPKASAVAIPDHLKGKSGQGVESLSSGDVALPLIKIAQATSKEITQSLIEGLKIGDFYHTLTEDVLGQELRGTIIYCDVRAILWRPRDSGGGILARSEDLKTWNPSNAVFDVTLDKIKKQVQWKTKSSVVESGLLDFGSSNPDDPQSEPAGTRMYNMVVMLDDYPELSPSIITCQRSGIAPAKKILGKFKMSQAPAWGIKLKIQSVNDTNKNNQDFKNIRFITDGFVTDPEQAAIYEEWYKKFSADGVRIDERGLEEASADAASSQGGGAASEEVKDRPKY